MRNIRRSRYAIHPVRELTRSLVGFVLLSITSLFPLLTSCSSSEDRARYHLERGREFAAAGKDAAASIEFRAAVSIDSKNLAALLELADAAETQRNWHDLRFYLVEALTLDPDNNEVAVRLAILLRGDEPLQARQLLLTVIARDPSDASAQLALSKSELSFRRMDEALRIVAIAIEVDPGNPDARWHRGIVYEAMMKQDMLDRKPIDETLRSSAVDAFEEFIEVGGQPEWKARIEQARLLSVGSHNRAKALASARRALSSADEAEGVSAKLVAAKHLASIARIQRDDDAYIEAIVALLEVTPRDFRTWRRLAEFRENTGGSAEAVYDQLVSLYPDDPEVHILFAQHLGTTSGYSAAVAYINDQIDLGIDPPRLLSGLRTYQTTVYKKPQAERTLLRLQKEFPDSAWTALELARKFALQAQTLSAIATLESIVQREEIPEALEMLAKLERFHHRRKRAIQSARRAVRSKGYYEPELHRLYAETLFEGSAFSEHLKVLAEIEQRDDLTPMQNQMKAFSLYETDDGDEGRKILLELIGDPEAAAEATLEFARREVGDPKQQPRIRMLLSAAIAKDPTNRELIAAQIYVNVQLGRHEVALRMLEGLEIETYPAAIQDLRAHLRASRGDLKGAQEDANLALRTDPMLPNLIDFALFLYSKHGAMDAHLDQIELWIQSLRRDTDSEWLPNSRKIAQLHYLRSRMLRFEERNSEALEVLDHAISNYEYAIDIRIDRAYLIALNGDEPERAIKIARQIVERHSTHPRALNTLGFAYLLAEKHLQALEFLRLANRNATTPNPRFLYQESLALRSMGRDVDALELIDAVLALDPSFPRAAEDRQSLMSAINVEGLAS